MNSLGLPVHPRVNQLDASLLDTELIEQLKTKLMDAFKFWSPEIKDKYEPELMLVLKALLYKVTIWDHATTYSAKLQNLVLVKASTRQPIGPRTKALYGIITVLGPYIWTKLTDKQLLSYSLQDKISLIWSASSLFNFIAFLFSGNYLTLVLRIIGARYVNATKASIRNVNYEFQNRQLIWNALTEFLLFVMPLVNYRKLIRKISRFQLSSASTGSGSSAAQSSSGQGPFAFLSKRACAICFEKDSTIAAKGITNPYVAGCEHAYCYVCLSLRLAEDPEWRCLKCNKQLDPKLLRPLSASD